MKYADSSNPPEGEGDSQPLVGGHLHHAAHGHFPLLKLVRTWRENEPDSGKEEMSQERRWNAHQPPAGEEATQT